MTSFPFKQRCVELKRLFLQRKASWYFVHDMYELYYLTGVFEEEAYGLFDLQQGKMFVLCDARLSGGAREEIQNGEVVEYKELIETLKGFGVQEVSLSKDISVRMKDRLKAHFSLQMMDVSLVGLLRECKDTSEIEVIQRASILGDDCFAFIIKKLQLGVTEKQLAWEVEKYFREHGAEALSFPPIIAFGDHTSIPHHKVSDRELTVNTPVLIDMGCVVDHYCSDMTRMVWFGDTVDEEFQKDFKIVLQALKIGYESFQSGAFGKEVDFAVRDYMNTEGVAELFTHSLGHGVGLEVHDSGKLSSKSDTVVEAGFVSSIEPGLYREGKWGIRLEDLVVITSEGKKMLTKSPRGLAVISPK